MSYRTRKFILQNKDMKNPPVYNEGIANDGFEKDLELKNFTMESPLAGKQESKTNAQWDVDDHRIALNDLLRKFESDQNRGLKEETVKKNQIKFGENKLFPPKKTSELMKFVKSCLLGMNLLFWICGITSVSCFGAQYLYMDPSDIVLDNLWQGVVLLLIVFIAGCFQYYQEFKSSKIMESFNSMMPSFATVIRDGKQMDVNVEDLVCGDIVNIKYGDRVPADLRILDCSSLKVDNSSLTGESDPQKRDSRCTNQNPMETRNIVFFSTIVTEGNGRGIVFRVGESTFMGRLASLATSLDASETPIAIEVKHIILIMTTSSLAFGLIFLGVGFFIGDTWVNAMFFAIGIIIANVPESLNVTLTIILALTAKRMAQKNCLVKHLHAVETLGSASCICTDKTGTLTQNKMSVAHLWLGNKMVEADTSEFQTLEADKRFDSVINPGFHALSTVAMLCSRAQFKPGQDQVPILLKVVNGDSSEAAILKFMEIQVGHVEQIRQGFPKVCEIPFNSRNKFQVSVHQSDDLQDPRYLLVMKGAPERVIDMCTTILIDDVEHDLDDMWRDKIDAAYGAFARLGERVLGFCDCRLPTKPFAKGHYTFDSDNPEFLTVGFRFVGLISMIDPPRATVPDAVLKCRGAGIKVVMVTGDHPITATAIGRSVGIISQGSQTIQEISQEKHIPICDLDPKLAKAAVLTGSRLEDIGTDELEDVLRNHDELIFARVSPEQKFRIVKAFQNLGHTVAVTGDGVNDAPALKRANIGIAMGITGTDVAKEVADMILLDDNFASIVGGVEDGRLIFDNLRKLFRYVMADNIAQMYCYWIFVILGIPLPMATIPMLVSTSGTDIFPAISLAYESPEADILKLKPRDPTKERIITKSSMSYSYGQVGVIQTFAGFMAYFVVYGFNGWYPDRLFYIKEKFDSIAINDLKDSFGQEWSYTARQDLEQMAQTGFFMALVALQLVNCVNCKTRRMSILDQKMSNWMMNVALLWAPVMACILCYTPYLNDGVNLSPLNWQVYLLLIPFMTLAFFYDELRRLALRTFPGGWIAEEFSA